MLRNTYGQQRSTQCHNRDQNPLNSAKHKTRRPRIFQAAKNRHVDWRRFILQFALCRTNLFRPEQASPSKNQIQVGDIGANRRVISN